ncbi:MAG TPA: hypothetical protein DEP91_01180 [Sphingomonas bacterium]|jgi:hypothetical protein|uniref:Uncharacterized protein n=1 Tax=Sphingomonas bacterium TaxID=1895847 RepID=A0A3D0WAK4_9SPHN|nr:hypothetical protein [Sphingomonas bacterium]
MTTILHHQNLMLSLRQAMGWPLFKPQNDCIAWTSGKVLGFEDHLELGRICRVIGKDLIYSGWLSAEAPVPADFTVAYRMMMTVDITSGVVPFAKSDVDPVILVDTRLNQHFAINQRGTLVRHCGRPKAVATGHRRAMKRIEAAARAMGDEALANNRRVDWNATEIEPDIMPTDTIVRFS